MAMPRRRSAWHGELASVNLGFECVQTKMGEAAGGELAVACFGCWAMTLFCNELDEEKWSEGCTRER
jgi:hypothetical protein